MKLNMLPVILAVISVLMFIHPPPAAADERLSYEDANKVIHAVKHNYYKPQDMRALLSSFQQGITESLAAMGAEISPAPLPEGTVSIEKTLAGIRKNMEELNLSPRAQSVILFKGLKKMFDTLGDEGTKIEPPDLHFRTLKEMGYDKGGAGFYLDEEKDEQGRFVVLDTLPGFPTEKLGVQTGDRVIMIDGLDVRKRSYTQIADLVRGPIGSNVTITFERPHQKKLHIITVKRRWLAPNFKAMEAEMLDNHILYVRIKFLGENLDRDLKGLLKSFEDRDVRKIIFDLRNNGGNVDAGWMLAGCFLPADTIIATRMKERNKEVLRSKGETLPDMPMAVVVNGKSGSPSILFAAILRDYGRAVVVGADQEWAENIELSEALSSGVIYSITSGYYTLPKGQVLIRKTILKPDIPAKGNAWIRYPLQEDGQIQKAIEILKKK